MVVAEIIDRVCHSLGLESGEALLKLARGRISELEVEHVVEEVDGVTKYYHQQLLQKAPRFTPSISFHYTPLSPKL